MGRGGFTDPDTGSQLVPRVWHVAGATSCLWSHVEEAGGGSGRDRSGRFWEEVVLGETGLELVCVWRGAARRLQARVLVP